LFLGFPAAPGYQRRVLLSTNELQGALLELALLFALCVGVAVTFHRFRLPPIVGFLVAGVLVGPNAIGLVQHKAMVEHLAEVGVVVLLFAVGLEVPLGQIQRLRRAIFVGGGLQIVGTIAATAAVAMAFGASWQLGALLGFLIALSSTAAATKILVDQGEADPFLASHQNPEILEPACAGAGRSSRRSRSSRS
jgi:CPA2 family monovalent cation:H+ antiporter-2